MLFSGPVIAGWKAAGAAERALILPKCRRAARWCNRWPRLSARYRRFERGRQRQALESKISCCSETFTRLTRPALPPIWDELRARSSFRRSSKRLSQPKTPSKEPHPAQARDRHRPRPEDRAHRSGSYKRTGRRNPEEVRAIAYRNRQDYQNLQNQAVEFKAIRSAYAANGYHPQRWRLLRRQPGGRRRLARQLYRPSTQPAAFREAKLRAMWKRLRPRWTPSTPT